MPNETNMSDWRPTYLIKDPSETDMLDWRPTCLIGGPLENEIHACRSPLVLQPSIKVSQAGIMAFD